MIRVLAIIAITGFLLSIVCISGAAALGFHALARGDGKWISSKWLDHVNTTAGPVVEIDGTGPTTSRDLPWSGSNKLTVDVPSEVTFTQGDKAGVTITGPSDVIDRIELNDGEISLHGITSRNLRGTGHITIAVTAPDVTRFEFNGAQKADIRGYDQDTLGVEVNGSGDVTGAGHARALDLELNGASKADFTNLALANARLEMNGASSVTAGPTDQADVEINGVGEVNLLGQPKVLNKERHGVGSINIRDRPAVAPAAEAAPQTSDKNADQKTRKGDAKAKTS